MEITKAESKLEVMTFIQDNVNKAQSYTNKLPLKSEAGLSLFIDEIMETTGIYIVRDNQTIQMALMCMPYFEGRFKVIGPIIKQGYTPTGPVFKSLFYEMIQHHDPHTTYYFAYAAEHQHIKSYMKTIGASYTFTDYYLEAQNDIGESENLHHMIEYHPNYFRAFQKLHESTFTHNAMSARDIEASLDDNHHLFLYMAEGILKGYLYLIIDTQHQHAEIKYFSSHSDYRLKGIAFDLIQHAIHFALNEKEVTQIYFKIRSKNHRLVERFNELGFHISSEYRKFKYVSGNQLTF
ncbi:GNAT family N-acetyltransferase [Staphylococcus canis]|uniref:GNAT family N-acetyltransferase n=1 Tax=Staphylococcus canis TaxID=2724942 RepID=A0ABS0T7C8_9STAP|nr:GNAT family N-acetyltransferase [Staphylococcus canis]MBI5974643.1 GNAT family N-acetyltransferase [Staphylococcus canis]